MKRLVQPELLDTLPADDPLALGSRRDLRRINAIMRNDVLLAHALLAHRPAGSSLVLTEIGAGDGALLLRLQRRVATAFSGGRLTLLDRHAAVSPATLAALQSPGWQAQLCVQDVFSWEPPRDEIVVANLFLHHFEPPALRQLLARLADSVRLFIALEPRRARWPWLCAYGLGALGCNAVTRHDAVVSVRAGFRDQELSALWPAAGGWELHEERAGWFSHQFVARRR